ncbi:hypothetical protein HPB47_007832 [Ixodes persulcatus]|uniref:Uncharacterized protein n=1 Tax=Ixodes persulcatus TaxID=34615 RepID=A0AC60P6G8_IXOPE|nr:hypothetical protein HPB47_007832 [Ixodes persulcatus]
MAAPRGGPDQIGQITQFTAVNKKLDQLRTTVELLAGKVEELLAFKATGEKVAETVVEIQSSIDFLSAKYDTVLTTVATSQAVVAELLRSTSGSPRRRKSPAAQFRSVKDSIPANNGRDDKTEGLPVPAGTIRKSRGDCRQKRPQQRRQRKWVIAGRLARPVAQHGDDAVESIELDSRVAHTHALPE